MTRLLRSSALNLLVLALIALPLMAFAQTAMDPFDPADVINAFPIAAKYKTVIILSLPLIYAVLGLVRHFVDPVSLAGKVVSFIMSGWKHPLEVPPALEEAKVERLAMKAAAKKAVSEDVSDSSKGGPKGFVRVVLLLILAAFAMLAVSVPRPARASSPLVVPVVGEAQAPMLKLGPGATDTTSTVPLGEHLWLAPSAEVSGLTWSSRDHFWTAGVTIGGGYGINWKPANWTATNALLALDLHIQAAFAGSDSTNRAFILGIQPTLVLFDWIGVGCGPRVYLPMQSGPRTPTELVCTAGITKAAGLPW